MKTKPRTWLKEIREGKGLTASAVARMARMDEAHYSRIENGKIKHITFNVANRIAQALGFSVCKFYGDEKIIKLKAKIWAKGFTYGSLAKELHISVGCLLEKISGRRDFKWKEIKKLCTLLCIENPLDWFYFY